MQRLLLLAATSAALVGRGSLKPRRSIQRRVFGRQGIDLRPLRPLVDVVEEEYITADSKLTKDRSVVIVTTASLPWMTGTAVNPALRAAYMAGGGYGDVTLMLPWMADGGDQTTLFGSYRFPEPAAQEAFVRAWIAENAPDAVGPDGSSSLKIGWYPARYAAGLGSILNLDDITESQVEDLISACERLLDPEQMGERYKVLAVVDAGAAEPPAGFVPGDRVPAPPPT